LYRFETHVQEQYAPFLQRECKRETDEKSRMYAYARTEADRSATAARATPSCDSLDEFKRLLQNRR